MGFFSKFERRVEDGFDDMGDKFFDSPISPVQIAKKGRKANAPRKNGWRRQRIRAYVIYGAC